MYRPLLIFIYLLSIFSLSCSKPNEDSDKKVSNFKMEFNSEEEIYEYMGTLSEEERLEFINVLRANAEELVQKLQGRRLELKARADKLSEVVSEVAEKLHKDSTQTQDETLTWQEYHKKKVQEGTSEKYDFQDLEKMIEEKQKILKELQSQDKQSLNEE